MASTVRHLQTFVVTLTVKTVTLDDEQNDESSDDFSCQTLLVGLEHCYGLPEVEVEEFGNEDVSEKKLKLGECDDAVHVQFVHVDSCVDLNGDDDDSPPDVMQSEIYEDGIEVEKGLLKSILTLVMLWHISGGHAVEEVHWLLMHISWLKRPWMQLNDSVVWFLRIMIATPWRLVVL